MCACGLRACGNAQPHICVGHGISGMTGSYTMPSSSRVMIKNNNFSSSENRGISDRDVRLRKGDFLIARLIVAPFL